MNHTSKFKEFLEELIADENQELYNVISQGYDLLYPDENVVKEIPIVKMYNEEICPHCTSIIGEKELYNDGEHWYHRPCIDSGPIIYADNVPELDSIIANIAGDMTAKYIKPKKYTDYEGDSSIPSSINYAFESSESIQYEIPHIDGKSPVKTDIAPKDRELNNIPKFSTGKYKVTANDWLEIDMYNNGIGKGCNGKWYGASHRARWGFGIGDKVKKGDCAYKGKEYTIKTDPEAKQAAQDFYDSVA